MPKINNTQDERQLMKLIEKLNLPEDVRNGWVERIRNGEMSEELAEEIRGKLGEAAGDEHAEAARTRHLVELSMLVKRWRFSNQSRNFSRK